MNFQHAGSPRACQLAKCGKLQENKRFALISVVTILYRKQVMEHSAWSELWRNRRNISLAAFSSGRWDVTLGRWLWAYGIFVPYKLQPGLSLDERLSIRISGKLVRMRSPNNVLQEGSGNHFHNITKNSSMKPQEAKLHAQLLVKTYNDSTKPRKQYPGGANPPILKKPEHCWNADILSSLQF